MAAWFVMLILLVGVLLSAAARIDNPKWITGFLAISSVGISVLVMVGVFLMLTRFRPHLQGQKEYAAWLREERRFTGRAVKGMEIRHFQQTDAAAISESITSAISYDSESDASPMVGPGWIVEISNIEGAPQVLAALSRLGLSATIYESGHELGEMPEHCEKADHTSIWIGYRVPPRVAVQAIKAVVKIWPHLRYMHVSSDAESPPDFIHDEIYFGGSTATARRYGLKRWLRSEIVNMPDDMSFAKFHEMIRRKYTLPSEVDTVTSSAADPEP
jgi:hypothetical protein